MSVGTSPVASIGLAWLEDDGTLVMSLTTDDPVVGGVVNATFRFEKDDPKRAEILAHLGGLAPGERKPVPPW
jgi:hypothetical protein